MDANALDLPLQQSDLFAAALRHLGQDTDLLMLRDRAGPVGRMLVVRRTVPLIGPVSATIRGPVLYADVSADRRRAALARHGPRLIEAEVGPPAPGYLPVFTPAYLAEIDLTGSPDARRKAMAPPWRAALQHAESADLCLRHQPFQGAAANFLLAMKRAQRQTRRYRALPLPVTITMAKLAPEAARLFIVEHRGIAVAMMLIILDGLCATYQIGWSGAQGRAFNAHHLCLTRAADWLAARGITRLDLGTIDTVGAPGLARFKIGSGAQVRALGGSWLRLPGAHWIAHWIAGWNAGHFADRGGKLT